MQYLDDRNVSQVDVAVGYDKQTLEITRVRVRMRISLELRVFPSLACLKSVSEPMFRYYWRPDRGRYVRDLFSRVRPLILAGDSSSRPLSPLLPSRA